MAASSDDQSPSPANKLDPGGAEMRALAQRLARESRKSAIAGFFGGVIVVVGLGATYYAFLQSRSSLQTQIVKTDSLQTEVHTKTAEVGVAKQQAETTKAVLSATVENLQATSPAVSASTTAAINKAFDSNPNAAKLLARVYIHTTSPAQHDRALDIANALRAAGYLVPGIDVQEQTYRETEVHYYADDSQSLSDVESITSVMAKTGIAVSKRMVPPAKTDKLLPRAYGLWLAPNLQSSLADSSALR